MKPPVFWRAVLRWSLDADHREDVDADLVEEHADRARESSRRTADRWYRRQALAFAAARLRRRRRWQPLNDRGFGPGRRSMKERAQAWIKDLRHAGRALRRTPGFTLMAATTLALAIGANAAMFSVVHKVLIDPLPYAHADRLVHIGASAPGTDMPREFGAANEFFLQYKEQSKLLEDVSIYNSFTSTMRAGDRVERIRMSGPTNSLFSTLGAKPVLGRLPNDADENHVAIISDALWTTWFGRDPGVLNQSFFIGGSQRTVVGIMPPEFRFPDDGTLLWLSGTIRAEGLVPGRFGNWFVARMKPGATPEAVATELNALARQLPERFGGSPAYARVIDKHRAIVLPLEERILGPAARPLWVLLGAVGIVLLIACANVANLFLVRGEGRQRDLAVRRAIGAARGQLIRLQMAEAIVVAAIAAAMAVALAWLTLPIFLRFVPPGIPRIADVRFSVAVWWFTLGVTAFTALACGVGPAVRASRPDFMRLREGGRGSTGRRHWARNTLVAGQTALALVLLIGSGLLLRSYWALSHVDPGYSTRDLFTFQIAPDRPELRNGPAFARFDLNFMERLRALPGVETVGLVENIPLNEGTAGLRVLPEGRTGEVEGGPLVRYTFTAGDYFKAMDIAVLSGQPFTNDDHLLPRQNVIVSRNAAALLWPGEQAVGKRFRRQGLPQWFTVVGVVEDVMQDSFREAAEPLVYFPLVGPDPLNWVISSPAFVIKSPRAETIAADVRALVRQVAPEAPMYRVYTMTELADDSMVDVSFTMLTLAVASGLALLLGSVGLYAVLSYIVAERTREIGVRMALGAQTSEVRRLVVMQGSRVVMAGVGIGLTVALLSSRALGSLLYGIEAVDAPTFVAMSISMIAVGLLACYLPARRASNVDPVQSLRGD